MLLILQVNLAGHLGNIQYTNWFPTFLIQFHFRVSFLDVSSLVGLCIGNYFSASVYEKLGFNGIFGLTAAFLTLNLLYIFFFLEESR